MLLNKIWQFELNASNPAYFVNNIAGFSVISILKMHYLQPAFRKLTSEKNFLGHCIHLRRKSRG